MKKLYCLSERNGIWQLKDATTGKRESLKTTSKAEAIKLADAKYEDDAGLLQSAGHR